MKDNSGAITITMAVIEDVAVTLVEEVTVEAEATTTIRHAHPCRIIEDDTRLQRHKTQASRMNRAFRNLTNMRSKDQRKQLRAATRAVLIACSQTTTPTVGRKASLEQPHQQEMQPQLAMVGHDYRRVPIPTWKRVARLKTTRRKVRKWRREA